MMKDIISDYSNFKIYTFRCRNDDNKICVGSTIQPLHQRFYQNKKIVKVMNV